MTVDAVQELPLVSLVLTLDYGGCCSGTATSFTSANSR